MKMEIVKIVSQVFKTALSMAFITFCSFVLTFFVAIFNAEGVRQAVEIFRNLF